MTDTFFTQGMTKEAVSLWDIGKFGAKVGKGVGSVVGAGVGALEHPIKWGVGAAGLGARAAGKVLDKALWLPGKALGLGAKTVGAVGTGLGGLAAGAAVPIASGTTKALSPFAKGYANWFKRAPVSAGLSSMMAGGAVAEGWPRLIGQNYLPAASKNLRYRALKDQFHKVGHDMEKKAFVDKLFKTLGSGKDKLSWPAIVAGGAIPLMGLHYIAAPSMQTAGQNLQRKIFPVEERIGAPEEIAKKELGLKTEYDIEKRLDDLAAQASKATDMPVLESNLEYLMENDPIIKNAVTTDPNKVEMMRETLETVYKFAPDIATNRQAGQSILREAAMSPDGGLNYQTIKMIAEAQKHIKQGS